MNIEGVVFDPWGGHILPLGGAKYAPPGLENDQKWNLSTFKAN